MWTASHSDDDDDDGGWFSRILRQEDDDDESFWRWPSRPEPEEQRERIVQMEWFWAAILLIAAVGVVALVLTGAFYALDRVAEAFGSTRADAWRIFQRGVPRFMGVVIIIGLGLALYRVRVKWRPIYGLAEFGVAGYVGWKALGDVGVQAWAVLIAVVSSAYFVVRGLDNFALGLRHRGIQLKWLPTEGDAATGAPAEKKDR